MFSTEWEAQRALQQGKISLAEFKSECARIKAQQAQEQAQRIAARNPLKDFVPARDAKIRHEFSVQDLDNWQKSGCYFRFQDMEYALGTQSFGMLYANAKEAMEDGSTVLDGKSCYRSWRDLHKYDSISGFSDDFCVLVFTGTHNGYGHDGEDVVEPEKIIAVLDYAAFMEKR